MPTRRQVLRGMGLLAAGGVAARTLQQEFVPQARASQSLLAASSSQLPACGTNKGTNGSWSAISAATGGLAGYRGYNTPAQGVPATWPGPGASPVPAAASLLIISIKPDINSVLSGSLDLQLAAFAAFVPAGAMVTCWHEGEATNNGFSTSQILGLHAHCYPIFKAASPGCQYGQIVTCYTATPASGHYPLGQWMAPGLDFYGLDGYQTAGSDTAASVFGNAATQIENAIGPVQLAVTECNSTIPADRPAWFNSTWSWAQGNGCGTYFTYWDAAGTGSSYAWVPGDSATISALSAINA
jgi:hypothetical protein